MGAVHRVARLESCDLRPAERFEGGARLGGRHEERAITRAEAAVGEHLHGTGEVHLALRHHHLHARMLAVGGAEDARALVRLVDGVLLGDAHRREQPAVIGIGKRDLRAHCDRVGPGAGRRERDRDRPEDARRGAVAVADAFPVGVGHEAVQRREAADAQHHEVALLAGTDFQPRHLRGPRALRGQRLPGQDQRFQGTAAVGIYQGHGSRLSRIVRIDYGRRGARCLSPLGRGPPTLLGEGLIERNTRLRAPRTIPSIRDGKLEFPRVPSHGGGMHA